MRNAQTGGKKHDQCLVWVEGFATRGTMLKEDRNVSERRLQATVVKTLALKHRRYGARGPIAEPPQDFLRDGKTHAKANTLAVLPKLSRLFEIGRRQLTF
jgi:hypothetical protein